MRQVRDKDTYASWVKRPAAGMCVLLVAGLLISQCMSARVALVPQPLTAAEMRELIVTKYGKT